MKQNLVLALLILWAGAALGCPCSHLIPSKAYKKAQSVFVGTAVKETLDGKVRFLVQKKWKGLEVVAEPNPNPNASASASASPSAASASPSASPKLQEVSLNFINLERCGVNPTMGLSYLVYAHVPKWGKNRNQISFDSCSIKEAVGAERDLEFLNTLTGEHP